MREVMKEQFWAFIMALKINVHPRTTEAGSDFETQDGSRRLVARTLGVDGHYWDSRKQYFLCE